MRKKLRLSNVLAFALVIIMAMITINTVQTYEQTNSDGTSTTLPVEAEDGNGDGEVIDEDDIETPDDGEFFNVYKNDEHLKAYNDAHQDMQTNLGYKIKMDGWLTISAVGLSFPKQTMLINKTKYSDGNLLTVADTKGAKNLYQESFYNVTDLNVYIREGSSKNNLGTRVVYNEQQILDRDGFKSGTLPLIINSSTVKKVSKFKLTKTKDNVYQSCYRLELDNVNSVRDYRRQILTNGKEYCNGNYPTFSKVEIEFVVNSKGQFVSIAYDFVYHMTHTTGIPATCTYQSFETYSDVNVYNMNYNYPSWAR